MPMQRRVKLFCTEIQGRAVDRCMQLFSGYGYKRKYPIAPLCTDVRIAEGKHRQVNECVTKCYLVPLRPLSHVW